MPSCRKSHGTPSVARSAQPPSTDVRYDIRGASEPARARTRSRRPRDPRSTSAIRACSASACRSTCATAIASHLPQRGLLPPAGTRRGARRDRRATAAHGAADAHARAHVHRQRRQRADRHQPARAARSGRRSADARTGLSAVDRGDAPQRRPAACITPAPPSARTCPIRTKSKR